MGSWSLVNEFLISFVSGLALVILAFLIFDFFGFCF